MPHVLITRPEEDAKPLSEALVARGFEVTIEPMMTIAPRRAELSLDGVQAALVTSRNGARALAAAHEERDIKVLAVGDSTAALAREMGYRDVESAGGDSADLARLAIRRLRPEAGPVLHAAGRDGGGQLARLLAENGFAVRREVLYEAVPVGRLSDGLCGQLAGGRIDMALFYSPRTAAIFAGLLQGSGLAAAARTVTAVCLSPAVADALAPLAWRRIAVARHPDNASLLAAVDALQHPNREDRRGGNT